MEKARGGEYLHGELAFRSGVFWSCIYFYAGKPTLCELVNQLNDNDSLQWVLFVGLWECGEWRPCAWCRCVFCRVCGVNLP